MTPEELPLFLTEAAEAFKPILSKPSCDEIVRLHKSLTPILLQAGYNKSHAKHNVWVIIAPTADYLEAYKQAFVVPERIVAYPKIPKEEKDQTQRLVAIWKLCLKDHALYDTGVRSASAFILVVVYLVWYQELCHFTTFYTIILPATLLDHLKDCCMGLHSIDAVDLPLIIQGYYADAFSMPVYINMLKDAQRKSKITNLPLSNATLLAAATKAVFALQEYLDKTREWKREAKADRTWPEWKLFYKKV